MMIRRSRLSGVVVVLFIAAATTARAQDFPSGPITFVVPFPPGGSIDVILRAMAPKLQERMGKPVGFQNRPGGGGVSATAYVAKSPPYGHTLVASASRIAAYP